MTPEEYVRDAMRAFKESAFDPIAVGWIERAFVRAIGQAIADEREACAKIAANWPSSFHVSQGPRIAEAIWARKT